MQAIPFEAQIDTCSSLCPQLAHRSLRERGELLIEIAHPDFRSELRRQFAQLRHYSSVR